jgi:hypothetical protein
VSDSVSNAEHAPRAAGQAAVSTPDFDRREVESFGSADGHAVRAIGRMLVIFFFYSLAVMVFVGWWTWRGKGQTPAHQSALHGAEAGEDD